MLSRAKNVSAGAVSCYKGAKPGTERGVHKVLAVSLTRLGLRRVAVRNPILRVEFMNAPKLKQARQAGTRFTYPEGMEG